MGAYTKALSILARLDRPLATASQQRLVRLDQQYRCDFPRELRVALPLRQLQLPELLRIILLGLLKSYIALPAADRPEEASQECQAK